MQVAALLVSAALALNVPPSPHARPPATPSRPCIDTTVREVTPRLTTGEPNEHFTRQEFIDSGVAVTFNTKIGQPSGRIWAEVVHYGGEPGNTVMMNEHAGDRVRVCFIE